MEKSGSTLAYRGQLDSIRFLAAAMVLVEHLPWPHWFRELIPWGGGGVRVFFVLSGFLITSILLEYRRKSNEGQYSPLEAFRVFYIRRALRIFPLYYAVLLIALILGIPAVVEGIWYHLAYATNFYVYFRGKFHFPVGHFWTLAVEEQFYLVWPFLIMLPKRQSTVLFVVIASVAVGFVSKFYSFGLSHMSYVLLPNCLDSLGLGALLAVLKSRYSMAVRPIVSSLGFIGVLLFLFATSADAVSSPYGPGTLHKLKIMGVSLVACWIILNAYEDRFTGLARQILNAKALQELGKVSYGIYVYHQFVSYYVKLNLKGQAYLGLPRPWVVAILTSTITIALALLSWRLFEGPINRLKSKVVARQTGKG